MSIYRIYIAIYEVWCQDNNWFVEIQNLKIYIYIYIYTHTHIIYFLEGNKVIFHVFRRHYLVLILLLFLSN